MWATYKGGIKLVDFKRRMSDQRKTVRIDPIEIYDHLDRSSDVGELRSVQSEILEKWNSLYRDNKDTILKLHTGQGKTIIGLLMLQSYINEKQEPCVYLCPNNHLVAQTCEQAKRFGIPYVTAPDDLPNEFLEGKKILITSVQKMFHGYSKFGLDRKFVKLKAVVLDDAHLCIEIIKNAFKISVKSDHGLYEDLKSIFTTSLKNQGIGTFSDIEGNSYDSILAVPYWEWQEKHDEVTKLVSQYSTDDEIKYKWPLVKNCLKYCSCVMSGTGLEIFLEKPNLKHFGSFHNASSRIFMSATLSDDSVFVRDLDVIRDAVEKPLCINNEKWSGEKLVLMPQSIHSSLNREKLINWLTNLNQNFGIAVLTPSFRVSSDWEKNKAVIVDSSQIEEKVDSLKNGDYENILIFSNRYDGIDLPDKACRIIAVDGKPSGSSIEDRYYEKCISDSELFLKKCAQKIEQGFGRAVRGEKDYCSIIIIGDDLIRFLRSLETQKYFSDQTKKQIQIGLDVTEFAIEEMESEDKAPSQVFTGLLKQQLNRDVGWKGYYEEQMNEISVQSTDSKYLEIYELERVASEAFIKDDVVTAISSIQKIIDSYFSTDQEMLGWYLERMAKYTALFNPVESNRLQIKAHEANPYLLKPKDGMQFIKMEYVDSKRMERITKWINNFSDFNQMMLVINDNIAMMEFGISSEKFEHAIDQIGYSLGFLTERPEKKWKDGPDNLWQLNRDEYILFECKNQVKESRADIYKKESGQLHNSITWFEDNYPEAKVYPVMIINALKQGHQTHLDKNVRIMDRTRMETFKSNYYRLFNSLKEYKLCNLTSKEIQSLVEANSMEICDIIDKYTVDFK